MNDIELTKLRHEMPHEVGFPVFLLTINLLDGKKETKIFFTKEGLDKYVETIEDYMSYIVELKHVDDVREVSFKTNY